MKSYRPSQWLACKILGTGLPDLPDSGVARERAQRGRNPPQPKILFLL